MKNIYALIILLASTLFLASCNEELAKNPDINNFDVVSPGGSGDDGVVGELKANFKALNMQGEEFTSIDMGEPFMLVDASEGNPDTYKWNVDGLIKRDSTNKMTVQVYCPVDGTYDVSLEVSRSSDGATNTLSMADFITADWIPVSADFATNYPEVDGKITIKHGDKVIYTDNSKGLPDFWAWAFFGGDKTQSFQAVDTIQYKTPGLYAVQMYAKRTIDGESSVLSKAGYVEVLERIVYLVRATATDDAIVLEYNEPMMTDLEDIMDDLYVTYTTASGSLIVPTIESVSRLNDYEIEIKLDQQSYSDDKVLVYMDAGNLYDKTGLVEAPEIDAELCVYGHNLLENSDFENLDNWNISKPGQVYSLITENPSPSQGHSCAKMEKLAGNDAVGFVYNQGIPFEEGISYQLSLDLRAESGTDGSIELTRFNTSATDGKVATSVLSIGGGWMQVSGIPTTKWGTYTRTIEGYSGSATELFYNILTYGGSGTVYLDNVRLYIDNPR